MNANAVVSISGVSLVVISARIARKKMSRDCSCGNVLPKTKGSYLDQCRECYRKELDHTPHTIQCDDIDCKICLDKLQEIKSVIEPLYVKVLLESTTETENASLSEFQ